MVFSGGPIYLHEEFPLTVTSRVKGKRGCVRFEVQAPADLVPWVESAVYFLVGLGKSLRSELRHSIRDRNIAHFRKEHEERRKKVYQAYMHLRVKEKVPHREALKALVKDEQFSELKWTTAIFARVLPTEREIRGEVKRLREQVSQKRMNRLKNKRQA